jgi:hypothetical protein
MNLEGPWPLQEFIEKAVQGVYKQQQTRGEEAYNLGNKEGQEKN